MWIGFYSIIIFPWKRVSLGLFNICLHLEIKSAMMLSDLILWESPFGLSNVFIALKLVLGFFPKILCELWCFCGWWYVCFYVVIKLWGTRSSCCFWKDVQLYTKKCCDYHTNMKICLLCTAWIRKDESFVASAYDTICIYRTSYLYGKK